MDHLLCIPLGVVVERVKIDSQGQAYTWKVSAVLLGPTRLQPGMPLRQDSEAVTFFAGVGSLTLYPSEVGSYRENLSQDPARLYVVLAKREGGPENEPPRLALLTAAAQAAEGQRKGGNIVVDGLPMPNVLVELVAAYLNEHRPPETAAPTPVAPGGGRRTNEGA